MYSLYVVGRCHKFPNLHIFVLWEIAMSSLPCSLYVVGGCHKFPTLHIFVLWEIVMSSLPCIVVYRLVLEAVQTELVGTYSRGVLQPLGDVP